MNHRIEVRRREGNGKLAVAPKDFLGKGRFADYLAACKKAGARFSKADQAQLLDQSRLGLLLTHLTQAGFGIACDAEVQQLVDEFNVALDDKAKQIEATFAERQTVVEAASGFTLFPFQKDGGKWLMAHDRGLLMDEMGLGKTVQALIALPEPDTCGVLVVAPASVKGSWQTEAKRWRPDYTVSVLKGRNSFRWPRDGEIVILNWDILPKHAEQKVGRYKRPIMTGGLASKCPKSVVVIGDEAHAVKNRTALRTKRFAALSRTVRTRSGKVWLLTGTPLLNRPPELWQVLSAADLAREAFGSWPNFVRLFNGTPGEWGGFEWGDPADIDPSVPDLLARVSLMRRRRQVLPELPTKVWKTETVNGLDDDLKQQCDDLVDLLLGEGIDLMAANEEVDLTRVEKIGFKQISKVRSALATHKIPAMLALIEEYEEQEQPLVVFSHHRAPIDLLASRKGWAVITGDIKPEDRTQTIAEFQAGKLKGIALTIGAGREGITLTYAHHALFVDLAWTPGLNAQAEDRICRIGQDRGCVITRLVADHTLDQRVTELLHLKQMLIEKTVEASAREAVTEDDLQPVKPLQGVQVEAIDGCDRHEDEDDQATPRSNGNYKKKREAANDLERWAGHGLVKVAALDPDRASAINAQGFSKWDGKFGHSIARQFERTGKLTDKQWAAAVRLANKYRRQIGGQPREGNA